MMKALRRVLACGALVAVVTGASALTAVQPAWSQSGQVQLSIYKAGLIVGVSGGKGTLRFRGETYPLSIGGVSLGATIGASRAELVGEVYNLNSPYDIAGTYTATQAGVAVAGGSKVAELENSRGVRLEVQGRQIGLEFSLDLSGMEISMR